MLHHIYCDESRQSKDRFMVFSGIIIPQGNVITFEKTMKKYREECNMHSELKWSKVSKQKLNEYKRFIEYFFSLNNTDKLHFKSIIIDNHKVNHKIFNSGDKELGFYKFYYQLLLLFGRSYYNSKNLDTKFIIYPDHRNTKYSLNELKLILNNGISKKLQLTNIQPYKSIEPLNSKSSEIIQINDIILGAIGYIKNGYHLLADSSKAKVELCDYIVKLSGVENLSDDTKFTERRFTIWNFPLK